MIKFFKERNVIFMEENQELNKENVVEIEGNAEGANDGIKISIK